MFAGIDATGRGQSDLYVLTLPRFRWILVVCFQPSRRANLLMHVVMAETPRGVLRWKGLGILQRFQQWLSNDAHRWPDHEFVKN
jgi:hypothetical protein